MSPLRIICIWKHLLRMLHLIPRKSDLERRPKVICFLLDNHCFLERNSFVSQTKAQIRSLHSTTAYQWGGGNHYVTVEHLWGCSVTKLWRHSLHAWSPWSAVQDFCFCFLSSVSTFTGNTNPYQYSWKTDAPEKYMCYISHTEVKMPLQRLQHLHMPQNRGFTLAKKHHVTEVADV